VAASVVIPLAQGTELHCRATDSTSLYGSSEQSVRFSVEENKPYFQIDPARKW